MLRALLLFFLLAGLAAAEPVVVATVPVIADLARQVAGGRLAVISLVPPGSSLHSWSPTPADAQRLASASAVIANGIGFEPWLAGAMAAGGATAPVIEASAGIAVRQGDADEGGRDPHAFHDVRLAQQYVKTIRDALVAADQAGAAGHRARADLVLARLGALDAWIRRQVATIPAERRVLITPHASLGYYAAAYGFTLASAEGVAAGAEADAQHVAGLVTLVRERHLPALFREVGHPDGVLAAVARDAGARLAGPLAGDGPGPGQSYDDMMMANTLAIVEALRP